MSKGELKIFAVILNWNNFPDTNNCIKSLLDQNDPRIHIVVVDNHSTDDSVQLIKSNFPELDLIVSEKNLGYAGGMNLGIRYALENGADYIIISNNDIVYSNNFLNPMLELFSKNPEMGIVSPKVLYLHDRNLIYCSGGEFSYLRASGVAFNQGKNSELFDNDIREITMAEGSCYLAKSDVFINCGLISEKFFMYFEDLEFSDRVRKKYKIFYTPFSKVYHKGGAGNSWANHSSLYYYYYTRNRYIYFSSYSFIIKIYVLIYSLMVSLAKSFILIKSAKKDRKKLQSLKSLYLGNKDGLKELFTKKQKGKV
ncbi:MAG: glycosyltransferase family 2 protein [Ignavibacteriales bacterium]